MRVVLVSFILGVLLASAVLGQQRVGAVAETFNATTLQGQDLYLDELRGKVVVLNFWSTKCAICHEEIPKLNKLVDKFSGKEVVFLGLTMENETRINLYLQKRPFKFTIVPNSLGVLLKYADKDGNGNPNMGFPAYFIISPTGELQYKSEGWDKTSKIESEVNRLLASAVKTSSAPAPSGKVD